MTPLRVLILGGTGEASRLAAALAGDARVAPLVSFAGRTDSPTPPPVPFRVGGFGGAAGLAAFLRRERIDRVVDATHPFAARMSANAVAACAEAGVPLVALERAPWRPGPGDRWIEVDDLPAAADALGEAPRRVFLAIGRLFLDVFAARPQHAYLVRLVDPPRDPLPLPRLEVVVARGPFDVAGDRDLLARHGSDIVVSKNSGGDAAYAKIAAARALALPVVMVRRPAVPDRPRVESVEAVLRWLAHGDTLRGV